MSLTKVSYSMISGAPLNVLDFGAKGDGVTNDTAAIQAAIDYAYDNNSGDVYFPEGTYAVTTLTLTYDATKTVNIIGSGQKSTIFTKVDSSTTPIFDWSAGVFGEAYSNFKSFTVRGNNYTNNGMNFTLSARFYIEDITFTKCAVGLYNYGALLFQVNDCQFKDNLTGYQSVLYGTQNKANAVTFNGGCFQGCTHWALDLGGAEGVAINNVDIEQCGTATPPVGQIYGAIAIRNDIDVASGHGKVTINESWLEQNGGIAIYMEANQTFHNGVLSINNTPIYNTAPGIGNCITANDGYLYTNGVLCASSTDSVGLNCVVTNLTNSTFYSINDTSASKYYVNVGGNFAPITYQAPQSFTAKAWVTFKGTLATPEIYRSGNVSSVAKLATGVYRITFTSAMSNANYAVFGSANEYNAYNQSVSIVDQTTAYVDVAVGSGNTNAHFDNTVVSVCVLY